MASSCEIRTTYIKLPDKLAVTSGTEVDILGEFYGKTFSPTNKFGRNKDSMAINFNVLGLLWPCSFLEVIVTRGEVCFKQNHSGK